MKVMKLISNVFDIENFQNTRLLIFEHDKIGINERRLDIVTVVLQNGRKKIDDVIGIGSVLHLVAVPDHFKVRMRVL